MTLPLSGIKAEHAGGFVIEAQRDDGVLKQIDRPFAIAWLDVLKELGPCPLDIGASILSILGVTCERIREINECEIGHPGFLNESTED
ncbi:MAG: hypothetical protein KA763_05205 [Xanthomonadales bacterium]|nr:hypothetical protein [Xanthomonadales bacterium]